MYIQFRAGVLGRFKRRAVGCFPNEVFGYLIGYFDGSGYEISHIHIPVRQRSDETSVSVDASSLIDATEEAISRGHHVIGSLHTHTYQEPGEVFDPVPSIGDYEARESWEKIIGVMNVYGAGLLGGRKRCSEPFCLLSGEALEVRK